MLHRIKRPDYGQALDAFLKFQRQLVIFACTPGLSFPLTQEKVCQHFQGERAVWLCKKLWFQGKYPTKQYHKPLDALITHIAEQSINQPQLGQHIIDIYTHDSAFHQHFTDATFRFHYPTLDEETCKYLKEALVSCYRLLGDGFLLKKSLYFTHKDMLKAFRALNEPTLRVCPMCDGEPPLLLRKNATGQASPDIQDLAEADHFFPKSRYPFLSIHPYNLVPVCGDCNKIKHDTDPLTTGGLLADTFHPYVRPAIDEIEVHVKGRTVFLLDAHSEEGTAPSMRLQNLQRVLPLKQVWEENSLRAFIEVFTERLRNTIDDRRENGEPVDETIVLRELKNHLRNPERKIGKEQHYLVTSSYARYMQVGQAERATLMEVITRLA